MAYIKTMKDTSGKTIYPQTHAQAVYASDGMTLEAKLNSLPTKISEFENDAGFITNTVDNLTNYYKKTELYTQTEVNNLINAITTMNVEVVTVLPTENISTTTIYLKAIEGEGDNNHEEWLYANGAWELIGTTAIDLTPYATKKYVNTQFTENQADWNENDSSSTKYIQNRTHYMEPYGASYFDPAFIIKNISANVMRDAVCGFPREEFILLLTDMNNNTETLNVIPTANNGTITGSGDISISYYCGNLKLLENNTTFTSTSYSDTGETWCLIFGHMEIPYVWFISSVDMNMMDMRRSGETIVKLDNKYLDIANIKTSELNNDANFINEETVNTKINAISTVKDWNENDTSAAAYIENRTHYVEGTVISDVPAFSNTNIDENSWYTTEDGNYCIFEDDFNFVIGEKLHIIIDGVEHLAEIKSYNNTIYAGNLALDSSIGGEDTGEEFLIIRWEAS